jgi:hypothetical protein
LTVKVPVGVDAEVAIVKVDPDPAVAEVGLKLAVAPVGTPVALNVTVCAVPEATAVDTEAVADEPCVTEPEAGLTESEKSLATGAVTVRV